MTKTQRALVTEVMKGPEYFVALILRTAGIGALGRREATLMTKTHCNVCDDVILDTVPHLLLLVSKGLGSTGDAARENCSTEDVSVCGRCRKGNGPGGAVAVLEMLADVFDEVTDPEGT